MMELQIEPGAGVFQDVIESPRSYDFGVAVSSGRIENGGIALDKNRLAVGIEENFGCHAHSAASVRGAGTMA